VQYDKHYQHSLLRYPGGKTRAVKHLLPYFPDNLETVCSPFIGGGSLELALASAGVRVYGYDCFEPLVNFWKELLSDREEDDKLHKMVSFLHKIWCKPQFLDAQEALKMGDDEDNNLQAAFFYAVNRSSFSGTILSGGYGPGHPRFNPPSIQRLKDFRISGLTVEESDFEDSIKNHPDDFLYCDPPYLIKSKIYGVRGNLQAFDHEKLAELLNARSQWILSYNNCPEILELYKGNEIVYPEWKYGMSKDKDSKEILIIKR
jgi:DNA adenine methylase